MVNLKARTNREKTRVSIGARLLSHYRRATRTKSGLAEEKEKRCTGEESHKTVIFHHDVEAPFRNRFAPKFVDLADVITSAKFGCKIFIAFSRPSGGKKHFPFRKQTAYVTVPRATALAWDRMT